MLKHVLGGIVLGLGIVVENKLSRTHPLVQLAHMTHEEECAIDLNTNSYIIDFSAMQQVHV